MGGSAVHLSSSLHGPNHSWNNRSTTWRPKQTPYYQAHPLQPSPRIICGASQISDNTTRTGTPELVFPCSKIPRHTHELKGHREGHERDHMPAATTGVALAGSPRWRWAWLYRRTFLSCT